MILYKATCSNHNYESRLYANETSARAAASRHRRTVSGRHNLKIVEVYVPDNAVQIVSERDF